MPEQHLLESACIGETIVVMPVPAPRLPVAFQHWREFICGAGAAFTNTVISYPLNKLIFRQMLHGVDTIFAIKQLHKEGLTFLYRGMLPPLLQRSLCMSVMFGVYDKSLQPMLQRDYNPYLAKSTAGMIAGSCEAIFMPFERVQTLLIHPKYHSMFRNTGHAFIYIATNYSIIEFYRGLFPILLRNGPSNALFFIIRDEMKYAIPPQDNAVYDSIKNFIAGASIGAFLSTLFYPLNVVKINMTKVLGGQHTSIVCEFRNIYRKRGSKLGHFYHGALLNISRAFLSWGIINSSYEIFRKLLYT